MAINVRAATRGDVGLILELIRALAEYEKGLEEVEATEALLEQHLFGAGIGRGPVAECVIGEQDGVAQGFALFFHNFSTWKGKPGVYLEDLFVRPEARGTGLGKALLEHVAGIAVERGCGRFEWIVLDWNTLAIEFYRAKGAEPLEGWTVFRTSGAALRALGSTQRG